MPARALLPDRSDEPTWLRPAGCNSVLKYSGDPSLQREIRAEAAAYFERTGIQRDGGVPMLLKSLVIVAWVVTTYLLMLFVATAVWHFVLLALSMALSLAGVGFSIQHDGGHGAYSARPWVSRAAAFALDAVGGSSYMWDYKHNVLHHTYPNVEQVDDDISQAPWLRLSRTDPYFPMHRYQFVYSWLLYLFMAPKWLFVDDFKRLFTQRAGPRRVPPPTRRGIAALLLGKVFAYGWMLAIPLSIHSPSWGMFGLYVLIAWVWGLAMAVTFQLAHCNDTAEFGTWPQKGEPMARGWAEQQIATTVNFSQDNPVLTWYLGGLNYQIEHHLFPKVCHLHYPGLSHVVKEVCERRGIAYRVQPTMFSALRSHIGHLKRLGAHA